MSKTTLKHPMRQTETRDKVTNVCMENFFVNWLYSPQPPILGDPGAVSRGEEESKRATKRFGRRNVNKERKSALPLILDA